MPIGNPGTKQTAETVAQAFQSLGLVQWWDLHISQFFGTNAEEGEDYNFGRFGVPVGSITAGRVVYVGDGGYPGSAIGQIVQVQTPDGALIHYQHLQSSSVIKGQLVQTGTVVGKGGGCPVGAYGAGTSCTRTDSFSTGEHIEVRYSPTYNPAAGVWNQAWQAPVNIFKKIAGENVTSVASGPAGPNSSGTGGTVISPGIAWASNISSAGVKIGFFALALVLTGFGFYLLFSKQVNGLVKTGVKAAIV